MTAVAFHRLDDGTLLQRDADGAFRLVACQTDRARLAALTDDEIEAMAVSDPDHPGLDDAFWASADNPPSGREAISIEIDRDVLGFFRREGGSYQTRINAVLRRHMEAQERAR